MERSKLDAQVRFVSVVVITIAVFWVLMPASYTPPGRMTPEEFFARARANHRDPVNLPLKSAPAIELPSYCKYKEALLVDVRSQGPSCSSCWAFAVADMLADRISVHTNGAFRQTLSVQELLSCFKNHEGCGVGGSPENAYAYTARHGLATEQEYPYLQSTSEKISSCAIQHSGSPRYYTEKGTARSLCDDLYAMKKGSPAYEEALRNNILRMKREIFLNGPIVGTVMVYEDLYEWDGKSIYTVTPGSGEIGGHAVEIIGWCDEGINTREPGFQGAHWCVRTSWGTQWIQNASIGNYGFFYIEMGTNCAGIESRASSALAVIPDGLETKPLDLSRYTSYTSYVNDPERRNFFATNDNGGTGD